MRCALRGARLLPAPRRGLAGPAGPQSTRQLREAEEAAPVFQYVGKAAKRKDRVFVWGFCCSGALGIPSFVKPDAGWKKPRRIQVTPYRLETEEKISSAACGYGFTLLSSRTTDITKVWGMGLNKDSQLGFQRSRRDRIFTMGNNSYGQCGRKVVEDETYSESHVIHQLKDFDSKVVQVVCGQDHSLFRTKKGTVYACGWGADGQTGLGHYNITSVPTKLHGDIAGVNIIQVSSYGDCCLAVSDEGDVFGWGNSEYLQLASVTETTQVNVPRHLPFKIGKVKEAACGGTGNVVLTEEGNVFVWGYGILGKGPNLIETAVPEMIPPSLFGWSDFNPDIRVAHVRCGLSHFAALTNRGELFVWGKNLRGCLGTGRMEDHYFPWRLFCNVSSSTPFSDGSGSVEESGSGVQHSA
ncbi:RCC1-like G exchanging factor-like protein isoform X4 [Lathamus discolor]|uniref:RCC1-like G exchanging factor-like protein isoform X4 n=1 Tax=Lathamus discolor TaxID=678569 RepID=UPI0032B800E5